MRKRILIVDDEESILFVLKKALDKYEVELARNGEEAFNMIINRNYDLIILDILIPKINGFEILERIKGIGVKNKPKVIVITAQNTMENAVEAMKRGAFDYISKPFKIDEIESLVKKAVSSKNIEVGIEGRTDIKGEIIGKSRSMQEIYKIIGRVSQTDVDILVCGESGTGKELIAKCIHKNSKRSNKPFVAINSAAIPNELLEAELFGFEKGAFTGAYEKKIGKFKQADGGTIFLDEIGDMPLDLQAKILRVIQEREIDRVGAPSTIKVDVRIIAATNKNLESMVKEGKFREDLFYRLNVIPIYIPPLRERKEDIPILIEHFLKKYEKDFNIGKKSISKRALDLLVNYDWHGNVRELENTIKRGIILSNGSILDVEDFSITNDTYSRDPEKNLTLEELIEIKLRDFIGKIDIKGINNLYSIIIKRVEKALFKIIVEECKGNQIRAANILGINRNTLRKKIKELDIIIKELKK
jgi:two-component system nitrogen regulation response regulator GlnG